MLAFCLATCSAAAFDQAAFIKALNQPISQETQQRGEHVADLIARMRGQPPARILESVNRHFNTYGYRSDRELWGRDDHWADPLQFIERGAGDCEDFAVAKYFALRAAGVPAERLEFGYVRHPIRFRSHMVLLYRAAPSAPALVLDNEHARILPLSERHELLLVYSFNEASLAVPTSGGLQRVGFNPDRRAPAPWLALLSRLPR